jgi:hypothetical protein
MLRIMKRIEKMTYRKALLALAALLLSTVAFGETYSYPASAPVLQITYPESWESYIDEEDGTLYGLSADEEVELNLWALDSKDVSADPEAALLAAAEEVGEIIDDWVYDFELLRSGRSDINGMASVEVAGSGYERGTDLELVVTADFFSPDDKTIFVLMFWGTAYGVDKYMADLVKITESIKKP